LLYFTCRHIVLGYRTSVGRTSGTAKTSRTAAGVPSRSQARSKQQVFHLLCDDAMISNSIKKITIEQPKTIRQKVYEYLQQAILKGDVKPGERLVESEIGKAIGTSRTPVREALHTLEREKLIESIPRVGYVVKGISKDELEDISEIRLVLETLALRWAYENDADGLTRSLQENVSRSRHLLELGDLKSFSEMDSNFHEVISKYASSERLQELTLSIRQHMIRYQVHSLYDIENIYRAMAGHQKIVQALKKQDLNGALVELNNHIKQSKKDIIHYSRLTS
jgi:DNA-binding GntR family transcriptional regulator